MTNDTELLTFPCEFPVKVFGPATAEFKDSAAEIIERHMPGLDQSKLRWRESGGGRFVALTVTIDAQSREQLDALYEDLGALDGVLMTL